MREFPTPGDRAFALREVAGRLDAMLNGIWTEIVDFEEEEEAERWAGGEPEPTGPRRRMEMPRGDGTGPMGMGPMTGRGAGFCAGLGAPDAAADLMQLGQAQFVSAIDEDGIGGRHVDTAFDDGGAHQQVATMVVKIQHHLFQLFFLHLPVCDADARIRYQFL